MPTVKDLIEGYGEALVGLRALIDTDKTVTIISVYADQKRISAKLDQGGAVWNLNPSTEMELLPKGATVKDLIYEYGEALVGRHVRLDGMDFIVVDARHTELEVRDPNGGPGHTFSADLVLELLPTKTTVADLIKEHGDDLAGRWVRWDGDRAPKGPYRVCGIGPGLDELWAESSITRTSTCFSGSDCLELLPPDAPTASTKTTVKQLIDEHGYNLLGGKIWFMAEPHTIVSVNLDKSSVVSEGRSNNAYVHSACDHFTGLQLSDLNLPPADEPKTPFELLDFGFAGAMCECWGDGVKAGRVANDWQFLPRTDETKSAYVAKIMRHLRDYVEGKGSKHLAAIACDANILWHLEGRGE